MKKKKLFIFFTDIDGTLLPMNISQMQELSNVMLRISNKDEIQIKICPISGRPSNYVLATMDILQTLMDDVGVVNAVDYGGGEQGGIIVYGGTRPYNREYIGKDISFKLKRQIDTFFNNSSLKDKFVCDPDTKVINSFVLKSKLYTSLNEIEREKLYDELIGELQKEFGNKVKYVKSGAVELCPHGVSKDNAIKWILDQYQKEYDICGIVYSGDSDNDKEAIKYISKLAEIPGTKAYSFLPSNARTSIRSENIEKWKDRLVDSGAKRSIIVGEGKYLDGILGAMKQYISNNELIYNRIEELKTKDDFGVCMKVSDFNVEIKQSSKDDMTL